jgi:hypothetical protein
VWGEGAVNSLAPRSYVEAEALSKPPLFEGGWETVAECAKLRAVRWITFMTIVVRQNSVRL